MRITPGLLPEAAILFSTKEEGTMSLRHGGDVDAIFLRRTKFVEQSLGHLPHIVEILPNGLSVFRVGKNTAHQIASNALFTTEHNMLLALTPADCHPIFIVDPHTPAVALIHGGRKEAIGGIIAKTIDQMMKSIDTDPAQCSAIIGPGIRSCCYNLERVSDDERKVLGEYCVESELGWSVDLVGFHANTLRQLNISGVLALPLCTACAESKFFSHYRSYRAGLPEERFFSGIVMTKKLATMPFRVLKAAATEETLVSVAA